MPPPLSVFSFVGHGSPGPRDALSSTTARTRFCSLTAPLIAAYNTRLSPFLRRAAIAAYNTRRIVDSATRPIAREGVRSGDSPEHVDAHHGSAQHHPARGWVLEQHDGGIRHVRADLVPLIHQQPEHGQRVPRRLLRHSN